METKTTLPTTEEDSDGLMLSPGWAKMNSEFSLSLNGTLLTVKTLEWSKISWDWPSLKFMMQAIWCPWTSLEVPSTWSQSLLTKRESALMTTLLNIPEVGKLMSLDLHPDTSLTTSVPNIPSNTACTLSQVTQLLIVPTMEILLTTADTRSTTLTTLTPFPQTTLW
jgi:hypothetical protein